MEIAQLTAFDTQKHRNPHSWTPEKAAAMRVLARAAMAKKKAQRLTELAKAKSSPPPTKPQSPTPSPEATKDALQPPTPPQTPTPAFEPWQQAQIAQIRAQMERLQSLMTTCSKAVVYRELMAAYAKAAEVERVMSGRPAPGSLRPSQKPARSNKLELD